MRRLSLFAVVLLAAALASPLFSQAPGSTPPDARSRAVRDAERELWVPGEARALRGWLVRPAEAAIGEEAGLAPAAPGADGWSAYTAWTDVVELAPPQGRSGPAPTPRYLYAYTVATRAEAGPAEIALGARMPVRIWVNGEAVGEVPGAEALGRDSVRFPVRLRPGGNRILLRAEYRGEPSRLTIRLLGPNQPTPAGFAPSLADLADGRLGVRTDLAPGPGAARLTVLASGGRTVAQGEGPRGGIPVSFDPSGWADGPYEIRVVAADAFGRPAIAYLPWYKGDPAPAARRVLERAAAAPGGDAASGHWRLLAALLVDRAGADLSRLDARSETVHSVLTEAAELEIGDDAVVRPSGMVRLSWIDPVDGSTQSCRAHLPPAYNPSRTWPTVLYLHGFNPDNPPYIRFWRVDQRHDAIAERWNLIWIEVHGRANTQYGGIGERDVLRCLEEAKRRLRVDENRVYLNGESMGGSGTWLIGSRHPGLFAAIAPVFGGWDLRLQQGAGFDNPAADRPMERWLAESHSSFAGAEQLINTPVLVQHGDSDRSVDVRFSRHIVQRLQRWGYEVRYREYPGGAHEDLQYRDSTVGWMLRHRRTAAPRQVRIRSVDLDGAGAWWVRVEGAERPMAMIEADAEMVEPGVLRLDTRNVAALTLSPPAELAGPGPLRVVWNSRVLDVPLDRAGRARIEQPDAPRGPLLKRAGLGGGLSNLFSTPFAIVVGTIARDPEMRGMAREQADRLAALWRAWQHVTPRIVTDSEVTPEMERSLSLLLIGGPDANRVSRRLWGRLPLGIGRGAVTIDGRRFAAEDALVEMIYPSPSAAGRYLLVVAGTSAAGQRLWDPSAYWEQRAGYRTSFYDWILRDGRGGAVEPGLLPERGWIASGVFDQNWRRDDRWTFPGDPAVRAGAAAAS